MSARPLLTVAICTHNRRDYLVSVLESLRLESAATPFEIIVVDNASSDGTSELAPHWSEALPGLRWVKEARANLSHARNAAWQHTRTEYIAYFDDDSLMPPGWIANALRLIREVRPGIFGGPVVPSYPQEKPSWYRYGHFGYGDQRRQLVGNEFCIGMNMGFQRRLLAEIGGFNPLFGMAAGKVDYGEDVEAQNRIRAAFPHIEVWYDPALVIHDPIRPSKMRLPWILKSDFANGRSKFRMYLQRRYAPQSRRQLLFARLKEIGHRARFALDAAKSTALLLARISFGLAARSRKKFPHRNHYLFERVAPVVTDLGMWAQGVWKPVVFDRGTDAGLFGRREPGICEDVKGWCEEQGRQCPVLAERRVMTRDLPQTLDAEIDPAFIGDATFESRERFVARIPMATIVGHNGLVRLPDERFAPDYINGDDNALLRADPDYWLRWQPRREKIFWPGSHYSVMGMYCREYHHWLHDVLMQFWKVLDHLPAETRIIVPAGLTPLQAESLRLVGIAPERLAFFDPTQEVTVEELVHIPPATVNRFDHPEAASWLRDRMWAALGLSESQGKRRRLYITRRRAPHRYVANEPELLEAIEPLGFEVVESETLSIADQVRLFFEAEIVIGAHGAGLTNLVFARPGTIVLEILFSPVLDRTHYWSLSDAVGLRYGCVRGDVSREGSTIRCIHVDVVKVCQTIGMLLNSADPACATEQIFSR